MSVAFKIKITKEILLLSKYCGRESEIETIGKNCAIAIGLNEMFPDVFVTGDEIYPFGIDEIVNQSDLKIPLPDEAKIFIRTF